MAHETCWHLLTFYFRPTGDADLNDNEENQAMLSIYLFWSERDITVFGLTIDPEGENLPQDLAPWSKSHDDCPIRLNKDMEQAIGPVGRTLREDGFYLSQIRSSAKIHEWCL
jgi:hypothetical protein